MEVDATIAEEFVEDDADYISAMKLAVSDDEEGSGGGIGIGITDDSGGCQASDSTCGRTKTVTGNRENGGTGDLASSKVNKRKFLHNLSDDGEKLYGFDEDTGRPIYGLEEKKPPIIATGTSKSDVDSSEHVASPPKKSRSSSDGIIESTLIKSSSQSPLPVATPVTPVPIVNSTAATTSVMSVSKPKSAKDEFYKKPFEFGWKRELVYRANPDTSKDKADVYFISPSGKKVRSRNEIAPLLDGELNVEHFSFAKEPLGVGSELEIVRNAKQSHRSATDSFHTSGISTSSGKRISKPKAPKGASPPPHGWTPTRALKNSSSLNTNSNSFATITGSSVGTSSMSAAASPKNTSKSGKSRKTGDKQRQPCTMQCTAAMGMIPQLQCIKCLCLYHHECVGLDRDDEHYRCMDAELASHYRKGKDYVCQSCVPPTDVTKPISKENQFARRESEKPILAAAEQIVPPLTSPSLLPLPSIDVSLIPLPPSPLNQPVVHPTIPLQTSTSSTLSTPISIPNFVSSSTHSPITQRHLPETSITTVTSVVPFSKATQVAPTIEPPVGDLPQSIAVIKGKKYVVVKKPLVQRSTNTTVNAENNAALDTGVTGDNDFGSDRSKRHNSSSSNSHRKHISNTGGGQQQQHAITTTTSGSAVSAGLGSSHNSPSRNNNTSQQHNVYSVDAGSSSSQLSMSSSSTSSFASNFFANVSVGYDAILHIFKYLKIHERPRAASVCKIWNLVAKDRSLWQTVRMKNSKVSNWAGFTAALRRGETKHLDLRKLLVSSTKIEEVWSEFCRHIGSVQSLVHIDMCRCSAQVVESLFVTNPNLTVLSALAINDEYLNLINIDNLSMLQELRLRTLEKCTLASDLTPLRTLKNLRCLTLSSIRQLGNKTIEVLGELKNLVSLELGECNDFDTRFTDDVLPKLSNLERLRLEIGQDQCRTLEILDSVAKLKNLNQLEFVNFDIKPGFDHKLAKCTNIRKLLIIPTYISQSATTNNIVLNAVLNLRNTLQVFTWGVTVELLRVTALYVDQCEDSKRKERHHFDECIPVLKPVPGSPGTSCDVTKKDEHDEDDKEFKDGIGGGGMNAVPQIEILPLDKVDQILHESLVTTKYTIVKIPYHATWKQQLVE